MNLRTKVYIAGPYTKPDPVENTHKACKIWHELWDLGFAPFCPHWTMVQNLIFPRPVCDWYQADLEWLAVCDVLLRLPGESYGADCEVNVARDLIIPVVCSVQELLEWRKENRV